jgi:hypothetical protein
MTDPVGEAVTQTIQDARQVGGTEQGGSVPLSAPSQAPTGNGSAADDGGRMGPSQVMTLPAGGVTWGKKTAWMDMPDDYSGMKIRVWVNYPNDFDQEISSRDPDKLRNIVKQIFLEHNGWVTPDEVEAAARENRTPRPMPQPTTDEFWQLIPNELAGAVLLLLNRETMKLPNSLIQRYRS